MLRPYIAPSASSKAQNELTGKNQRRTLLILGLPLMVILGLVSPNDFYQALPNGGLRKLAVKCVHNIYALDKQMALDLPRPPTVTASLEIPSYISICKEWIQRGTGIEEALYTVEDDTVCMDWSSPHERLLEIFSSSILDRVNGKSRYRHDCFKTRQWDEAVTGMDRTTIQQMIPVARMDPNLKLVSDEDLKAQCKVCLANFEPYVEKNQFKTYASHHCFGFPQVWHGENWTTSIQAISGIVGAVIVLPEDPILPNVVPLSTIYKQVRNRLGYVAMIFSNVTDAPPKEHESGVVIFIDPTSKGINKDIYAKFFPPVVTSITVLTSPLCATAVLATGQECMTYAEDLIAYFQAIYPNLKSNGFEGSPGIQFQMAASSAGAFSRMILAKKLICPPATPTCLFPAMSKYQDEDAGFNTTATILDCKKPSTGGSDCGKAIAFFVNVGHGQRVTIEVIATPVDVPKPDDVDAPMASDLKKAAEHFQWVMENDWADEGYLAFQVPQVKMLRSLAANTLDADILQMVEQWNLPNTDLNPNAYVPPLEVHLDIDYVNAAVAANVPINNNYGVRESALRVMEEMGLDVDPDLAFATRALTPKISLDQMKLRDASQERIERFVKKAKFLQYTDASKGDMAPSMEMEIYCPEVTVDGFTIQYDGGSTRIAKDDTVMISDGAGTVTFDKAGLQESTVALAHDDMNQQRPYTFIYDPVTNTNITIAGKNITLNRNDGIIESIPVGVLLVDNQTAVNTATLVTEGGSGSLLNGDTQKIFSGTVISTGMNRADKGNVIRTGDGYSINTDPPPGLQRTESYEWDKFNGRESPYSSEETGIRNFDREIVNRKQPKELTLQEQYDFEAKSPEPPIDLTNGIRRLLEGINSLEGIPGESRDEDFKQATIPEPHFTFTDESPYRLLMAEENVDIMEAMSRELHQRDINRGVAITIPTQDFKFGDPDELARVCHHHKEKVITAMRERATIKSEPTLQVNAINVPTRL